MSKEKFSRYAAITSQALLIGWLAAQLIASLFQKSLLSGLIFDNSRKVNSWAVIALCLGALCVTAANLFICREKSKNAPLLISAITVGIMPIAVRIVHTAQLSSLNNSADIQADIFSTATVYFSAITAPLSYFFYAAAAVTVAAAAVYAFGGSETFPRKVSIVSQVVMIAWLALQLAVSIFQKNILSKMLYISESELDEIGKMTNYASIALCLGALCILAANFLICTEKGKLSPIIISAAATVVMPFITNYLDTIQQFSVNYGGSDAVYAFGAYRNIVAIISYLFYTGAAIAITAAAVNLFKSKEKAVSEASEEERYDFQRQE